VTAETTLPQRASDPASAPPIEPFASPFSGEIPGHAAHLDPHMAAHARNVVSRRIKRLTETRELRIRTTHRRRKLFARGGVLGGFALAMVVYPIIGTVVAYQNPVANVPGVVLGESPTTGHALLGDGPQLIPTIVDMPSVDDQAQALAVARAATPYVLIEALPDCLPPAEYNTTDNGNLPADQLCTIWGGAQMRADAAIALAQMNEQFKAAFGRDLCIQGGYRSYADQSRIKSLRGYLAASPGTSMHGFGLAFDLCSGDDSGKPFNWLKENAAAFGYFNPDWAKFRKYEPWHWEYAPGVNAIGHYGNSNWADGASDAGEIVLSDTMPDAPDAPETTAPSTSDPDRDNSGSQTSPPASPAAQP